MTGAEEAGNDWSIELMIVTTGVRMMTIQMTIHGITRMKRMITPGRHINHAMRIENGSGRRAEMTDEKTTAKWRTRMTARGKKREIRREMRVKKDMTIEVVVEKTSRIDKLDGEVSPRRTSTNMHHGRSGSCAEQIDVSTLQCINPMHFAIRVKSSCEHRCKYYGL
jgi:hypothetical protein